MELDDTVYIELASLRSSPDPSGYQSIGFGASANRSKASGPQLKSATGGQQERPFSPGAGATRGDGATDARSNGRVAALTAESAGLLRTAITTVAGQLKPDLKALGASKATIKLGAKLTLKSGKLAALIAEAGGEGSVEITLEFTEA